VRIFRSKRGAKVSAAEAAPELFVDGEDDSDVFRCKTKRAKDAETVASDVTLFVYAWHSVAPGPLSWAFPNVRAALDAVGRMKNAVGWSIVAGKDHTTIDEARANGAVLIEQLA
jgi:hypothetical protein